MNGLAIDGAALGGATTDVATRDGAHGGSRKPNSAEGIGTDAARSWEFYIWIHRRATAEAATSAPEPRCTPGGGRHLGRFPCPRLATAQRPLLLRLMREHGPGKPGAKDMTRTKARA